MRKFSVLLLIATIAVAPQWVFAADNFKITVMSTNITGSCDDSTYDIVWSWTYTVGDSSFDLATMIATDEDDRAIASDWTGAYVTSPAERTTPIGNGDFINSIVPGKSITVEVFDSVPPSPPGGSNFQAQYDDISARPEPVALSLTFNPGNCDQELHVTTEGSATPVPSLTPIGLAGMFMILLLVGGFVIQRRHC